MRAAPVDAAVTPFELRPSLLVNESGSGQQTKNTVLFSVKGASEKEVREVISKCNDRAGKVTDGDTVIIQFESIKMYKSGDRRDNPTETRNITLEVGLAGQEGKFRSLLKHGLVSDDVHGAVFTGKFTPKGGYDVSRYVECLSAGRVEPQLPGASGAAGPSGLGPGTADGAALAAAADEAELAAAAATGLVLTEGAPHVEPMDV